MIIVGAVAGAFGFKLMTPNDRLAASGSYIEAVALRVTALENTARDQQRILEALALSACIGTTDIRVRAPLECARREAGR